MNDYMDIIFMARAKVLRRFLIKVRCIQQNENDMLDRWKNRVSPSIKEAPASA